MRDRERAGKQLVILIILFLTGFTVFSILRAILSNNFELISLFRLAQVILFSFFLYRGRVWAKWILAVLSLITGVFALVGGIAIIRIGLPLAILLGVVIFVFGLLSSASGATLISSTRVKEFMLFQRSQYSAKTG